MASKCDGGNRTIASKPNDKCIIYPELQSTDIKSITSPAMNQTMLDLIFMERLSRVEQCKMSDDILVNPMIKVFLISIAAMWTLIVVTLFCIFFKYRNLKTRYSQLGEEEPTQGDAVQGGGGEIELRVL